MKLLFLNLGMPEVILIAVVVLLFFGGKRIPELMNSIGRGVKNFREGLNAPPDNTPQGNTQANNTGNTGPAQQQ